MDIIDSITQQIIKEGEPVVLMLLVNSRSEDNDVGLLTRLHDQYKLASLPIRAVWTNSRFHVPDGNQFAIESLVKTFPVPGVKTLEQLIEHVWAYGHQSVEKPSWNCSSMKEYGVFAIKPDTLEKLASTSIIQKNVPLLTAGEHLPAAIAYAQLHMAHDKIPNNSISEEKRFDHYDEADRLKRVFLLRSCSGYDQDYDAPLPYAVYALNRSSSRFSGALISGLHKDKFALKTGELDVERYTQFYEGTHLATAVLHALAHLDIPLSPTHWAQSRRREAAKMEFMSKVLIEELNEHCSEAESYDDEPAKVVRELISPLKTCVSELTRLQHRLEDKAEKSR
ncbi:hypothetical protein [Pseudomonas amygdali]|uniref:Uncharacterized protein n=1 Tax=Pseudomonas amygdali pv. lachrymans str. M301315 TaxID=629260 RepID=A0AAD0PWP5_PSEAV|nr:hypothetical protein [Pseudomonas amygdali]AXH60146.1 hypothetical protein PLA107_033715 [Pseudomonas amygdali pv. lachrymans str. M301315]RMT05759.1 hypothetical protein ALP54_03989 [Pseudomonas amygdali pv. lachrymans]